MLLERKFLIESIYAWIYPQKSCSLEKMIKISVAASKMEAFSCKIVLVFYYNLMKIDSYKTTRISFESVLIKVV